MLTVITILFFSTAIIGNSLLEAYREVAIEGPFGWSALTFTKRYSPNSLVGQLFRLITGSDKVATQYHLVSAGLWFFMYFPGIPFIMMHGALTGIMGWKLIVNNIVMVLACLIATINAEDFLWFMIHPYYGPGRYNADYIPWIQNYSRGIQKAYITSTAGITGLVALTSLATRLPIVLLIWLATLGLVIGTCAIIRKKATFWPRKPLPSHWWKQTHYVLIERSAYPIEGRDPNLDPHVWLVNEEQAKPIVGEKK